MQYEIKQLELGGILNEGLRLVLNHFGRFLALLCVLQVPVAMLTPLYIYAVREGMIEPGNTVLNIRLLQLASFVAAILTNAAFIHYVASAYLAEPLSVGGSFGRAFQRAIPLMWTWFLVGLAIMGGMVLFIVPGILCMLWFAMATQVVVLEDVSGFAAMKRSRFLMAGNKGKLFVLYFLMFVINFGMGAGWALAISAVEHQLIRDSSAILINVASTILASSFMVVFYFSARCQHDNFDLMMLARTLGEDAEPVGHDDERFVIE